MLTREVMYDIETLPNMFLCTIYDPFIGRVTTYHAGYECNYTRLNEFVETVYDLEEYIRWLKRKNYLMVGFNNYHYDYPVIHHLLNNLSHFDGGKEEELCKDIFNFSTRIIEDAAQGNRFAHTIWDRDMIVPQLDLFKVHHFDNKAKTVSLKRLEFNMRRRTVLEYTEGFDHQVSTEEEVKKLIEYNIEDVLATYQFRQMSAEQVDFRKSLVDTWGIEVLNYNDTKIGEKLIERRLKEEVGLNALYTYEEGEYGETIRTMKQTPRSHVDLRDIIFPNVRFEARKLRDLLNFMKKLRVYVDGMRFEWSELPDYQNGKFLISQKEQELGDYEKKSDKWKATKAEIAELKEKYSDREISVTCHGATFELGKGGIHSAVPWGAYRKGNGRIILDVDVASFYPSIAIQYGMKPEHLPEEFTTIYAGLKDERMAYKKKIKDEYNAALKTIEGFENERWYERRRKKILKDLAVSRSMLEARSKMLKLALNGTYGKTNSIYSVLYDPEYSLRTVINGQLFLLMLWDMLVQTLPTIELIQANTDGISFVIYEDDREECQDVLLQWEKLTKMELETTEYESMFIRDVNNYVAKDINGKIKAKGAYNWQELYTGSPGGVVWHKNHSNVVSQKAACAYLLDGKNIEEYIKNHNDIFDFFLCTNVNRSSRLFWGKEEIQRNSRYLISHIGAELTKVMPPLKGKTEKRRIAINKGACAFVYNYVEDWMSVASYEIDYDWYIQQAQDLVGGFDV